VKQCGIQHVAPVEEFPIEQWDSIIAINLTSAFHTTRAAVPRHEEAQVGAHHQHLLGALAQGLALQERLTSRPSTGSPASPKTVALELAEHGVTSNAISPGFVWTPLVEKQIPDLAKVGERHAGARPRSRCCRGSPTSSSPSSSRRTGQRPGERGCSLDHRANYSIDGGWTAQ